MTYEIFGTSINRFCAQAVIGHPLTIYGKGGQIRGFLGLIDSIQCLSILLENPPKNGEYRIVNQFDQQYKISELAERVQNIGNKKGLDVEIKHIENPRLEKEEHYYNADHSILKDLGYKATRNIDEEVGLILDDLIPNKERIQKKKDSIIKSVKWQGSEN